MLLQILTSIRYWFGGAKVAAALDNLVRNRMPTGRGYMRPGAEVKTHGEGFEYIEDKDRVREWLLTTRGKLILRNVSTRPAYNISLRNRSAVFDSCPKLQELQSLSPNEKLELNIEFRQTVYEVYGTQADEHPMIPKDKSIQALIIDYENEEGRKLSTKFWLGTNKNEYTYA